MSRPAKVSPSAPDSASETESELPFEEALGKLESIVESMEAAELPLEELLAKFEEGARLSKLCQARLATAEIRVQQLERALSGDWETRPAELSVTAGAV